jgi:methylglyoxal synthase
MTTNRKMNITKRIAFVASDNNRKSLIEWAYYNQEILKQHELIAASPMCEILEGTIGAAVTKLPEGFSSANQKLSSMIKAQEIDILVFFWDPVLPLQRDNNILALYDMAFAHNIIIVANQATADFVLASALMSKAHAVPATGDYNNSSINHFSNDNRRVVLKVNTIH